MTATQVFSVAAEPIVPEPGLQAMPGHLIRRLQQIASALFMQEIAPAPVTQVQFAVLFTISRQPGLDQSSVARAVTFDASTIGGVIDRLAARGYLERHHSPVDRRVRLLSITPEGEHLVQSSMAAIDRVQTRLLEPFSEAQKTQFLGLARELIAHHGPLVGSAKRE